MEEKVFFNLVTCDRKGWGER